MTRTAAELQEQIDNLYPRAERDETGELWAELCRLEYLRLTAVVRESGERNAHVAEPLRSIINLFSAGCA